MKKRIFSLLLVLALMASTGMTVFAEPDPAVEPAPQETAISTETTPPAEPEVPTETEASVEPEVPTETEALVEPTETAPIPEGEPAADVPAAGEEVPGVDDAPAQDAVPVPDPNNGIATISEPVPVPASDLTLTADPEFITVQNAYACWKAVLKDPQGWKNTNPDGYITLTLNNVPEGAAVEWSVKPKEGGAGLVTGVTGTTCSYLAEGNVLYLTGGSDISGCLAGHQYWITVSATVNGQKYEKEVYFFCDRVETTPGPTETPAPGGEIPPEMMDPSDTKDDYTKGVWLHVVNGNFVDDSQYPNISGKASVWVEFQKDGADAYTRNLPGTLPQVKSTNGEFNGWYTQAPTEEMVNAADGSYCYRQTTTFNGERVTDVVPEGIQVLYATFNYAVPESGDSQLIQYYYDYNGMMNMYGHCLTRTGVKDKVVFTAQDAAVYNFNFDNDFGKDAPTWDTLNKYWEEHTFEGYTFKGWSLDEKGGEIIGKNTPVTNGMTFYAVWEKGDQNQTTFDKSDKDAGPLTHIRIISSLNDSRHASVGESMTVSVFCYPLHAVPANVTYTVTYYASTGDVVDTLTKGRTMEVTADGIKYTDGKGDTDPARGFDARIEGTSLVVTSNGQACTMLVSVKATAEDGTPAQTNGGDATLSFEHNFSGGWNRTKEPTCTGYGEETAYCATCEQTVTRKIYPTSHNFEFSTISEPTCTQEGIYGKVCRNVDKNTGEKCNTTYKEYLQEINDKYSTYKDTVLAPKGHSFKVMSTAPSSVPGAPMLKEECQVCHEEETVLCGDVNDDGGVNIVDLYAIYSYVLGETSSMTKTLAGDVNVDGTTNIVDLYKVYSYVLGEVPSL